MHHQQQQPEQEEFVPVSAADIRNARWGPALSDLADASASASSTAAELERASNPPPGPPDLLLRLSSVPVYAVVNKKDEFFLVTGGSGPRTDPSSRRSSVCCSCPRPGRAPWRTRSSRRGARATARAGKGKKIAKGDVVGGPHHARQGVLSCCRRGAARGFRKRHLQVRALCQRGLPRGGAGAGGRRRAAAVLLLLLLLLEAGAVPGFAGVPVFQAAGLSVSSEARRYTPLFLDSGDLDEAVRGAAVARDAAAAASEAEEASLALRAAPRGWIRCRKRTRSGTGRPRRPWRPPSLAPRRGRARHRRGRRRACAAGRGRVPRGGAGGNGRGEVARADPGARR